MVNLDCSLPLVSGHGSATADVSVMAHEAVEGGGAVGAHEAVEGGGNVGALKAVEGGVLSRAVGGGGALSQEVEEGPWLVAVLPPASPSPGGGDVGGGAATCSPTVSEEVKEVVWAGRGACPHASHATVPATSHAGLARGAVPATASGPFCVPATASETLSSSRDSLASRQGSGP